METEESLYDWAKQTRASTEGSRMFLILVQPAQRKLISFPSYGLNLGLIICESRIHSFSLPELPQYGSMVFRIVTPVLQKLWAQWWKFSCYGYPNAFDDGAMIKKGCQWWQLNVPLPSQPPSYILRHRMTKGSPRVTWRRTVAMVHGQELLRLPPSASICPLLATLSM